MTRVLSELLGRTDPGFTLGLRQVELSAGQPNADIRLSVEVQQGMRRKLKELGLDPNDTTGQELYAVLGEKLKADETQFRAALAGGTTDDTKDPIENLAKHLQNFFEGTKCYAVKPAVAKKLLKANLPKRTMKLLGYRSADSMLKHEAIASLSAAAWLVETDLWIKKQMTAYGKLQASDFESRHVSINYPASNRWQQISDAVVMSTRRNVASRAELGTVVLLPLPGQDGPALSALTTAALAIHAVNEISAASTFLKLHQVQPKFGDFVKRVMQRKTTLSVRLLDQPVSWSLVQQYFSRLQDTAEARLFEPVIQAEDFTWHTIESMLTAIEPGLHFWHGTDYLAHLCQNEIISLNLTDMLLSHCNKLPYEKRLRQEFRHALSTELALRYMVHDRLQESLIGQLQNQLAFEPATD